MVCNNKNVARYITDAKYGNSGWWCQLTLTRTQYVIAKKRLTRKRKQWWHLKIPVFWDVILRHWSSRSDDSVLSQNLNLQQNDTENLKSHTVVTVVLLQQPSLLSQHHKRFRLLPSTILFHTSYKHTIQADITKQRVCQCHLNPTSLYSQPCVLYKHSH